MDSEIPKWLSKEFVKRALDSSSNIKEGQNVTIENIKVNNSIVKPDNFLSNLFRVSITYKVDDELKETSLIIKSPVISERNKALSIIIEKEILIYTEVLPKLEKLLRGKRLTPESYYSIQKDILILEDLKKDYSLVDSCQMDYDHCVLALVTMATFHAASIKIHEDNPPLIEKVGRNLFFSDIAKPYNHGFVKVNFICMAEQCKNIPELNKYADLLLAYSENARDIMSELFTPKENEINVLNHGDYGINNMFFQYEHNKPIDLKLIDFQMSKYTWPSIDLIYFLYVSAQEDVRLQNYEVLLNIYLNELNSNLKNFGSTQRLTEEQLRQMMQTSEFYAVLISICTLPFIVADPDDVIDTRNITVESLNDFSLYPFKHYFRGKQFLEIISKRLVEFEKNGWF